ncbi:MAG: L-threonylcarbamoyladenylate synthase [Patescibacteria group bacterium]
MIKSDIAAAVRILKRGGVIVFPTETAYGLGADATNPRAVSKIFVVKGRSERKPLPLIVASKRMAERFFIFSEAEAALARRHWPGPLTLLLRPRRRFPRGVLGPDGRAAVRVSGSALARALSARLGKPITATSANRSGGKTCYSVSCVRRSLDKVQPEMVLDGGTLSRRKPSTIIRVTKKSVRVLRQGTVRLSYKK